MREKLIKEKKKNKSIGQLYKISKYVYNEVFLSGYLEGVGSSKENFIKKIEKNKNSIKNYSLFTKILSSLFIVLASITSYFTLSLFYSNINYVDDINFSAYLFGFSILFAMMFSFQFIFLLTYGLSTISSIFSSNGIAFRYLETLPLNNKEIKTVSFLTFFRIFDIQFISLFLIGPIIIIILTGSIIPIISSFIVSGVNLIFCISILVLVGNYLGKKIFTPTSNSKSKTIIRIFISTIYLLSSLLLSFMFIFLAFSIENLFSLVMSLGEFGLIINEILSFVIYPLSIAYFLGFTMFPLDRMYINQGWTAIVGFIIATICIILLFKKAMKTLRSLSKETDYKVETIRKEKKLLFDIKKSSPISAIFKKDLHYILRDFGATMFLIMPIVFPFFCIFQSMSFQGTPIQELIFFDIMILFYIGVFTFMSIKAALTSEGETGGLIFTLPIKQYDIYKGKRRIMLFIMFLSLLVSSIITIAQFPTLISFILLGCLSMGFIYFYETEITLILYSRLFGKIRNTYTLQEINIQHKSLKYIFMFVLIYGLGFLPIILSYILQIFIFYYFDIAFFISKLIFSIILFIIIRLYARNMYKNK